MKLILKRPLAFFDIEATGTNVGADRIVELSVIKLFPDGHDEVKTWRVNPAMPIPLEVSLIHGIYDADIADKPTFKEIGTEIADFIGDADLAGYNSNKFDIPMLMEEFMRANIDFSLDERHTVDVQNIFHQMEQRTLKAAYKFYCDKDIINAHTAEADTRATMEVLLAQIERYENTEFEDKQGNKSTPVVGDVEALHVFTNLNRNVDFAGRMVFNDAGEECFNFGKHKGRPVEEVFNIEPSYYSWMMQGDFPLYTKKQLEAIYKRWNDKRQAERAARPPQPKPAQGEQAQQQQRPAQPQGGNPNYNKPKPTYQQKPFVKREDKTPAKPVDEDMLSALKDKFKKL
ncbi:3'-5' exonuclease [Mucilaginibacter myungsuensis]|uniref:DNA polymerase III subunit epsilon n=1 Tax=Mucilaginibacter myungsuensis TaxID=649104 RepID=A0A929PUW0_9SPHI|nr:3'-5' exonuclease [Mucilaginibacter myungsuensis]MBE9660499.1 DNA polymerase III subunit epsilon [Mucilaginibacter myungsuensis]MDN3600543.1 exonuclease domain-containing protein [Mucilaginibacter myungsuensis]